MTSAACIALVAGIALKYVGSQVQDDSLYTCVVYVDGQRLTGEAAQKVLEDNMALADAFVRDIDRLQDRQELQVTEFMNMIKAQQ